MKTKYALIFLLIFSAVSCSKDNSVDEETIITRCFTVKELGTEIVIENATVTLNTFVCGAGCGEVTLGLKLTDSNGGVCFSLSERDNEDILKITCTATGYNPFEINSPELNFSQIYLVPE